MIDSFSAKTENTFISAVISGHCSLFVVVLAMVVLTVISLANLKLLRNVVLTKVVCATTIHKTQKMFELRALCIHISISQLSASIHTLPEHVSYETRRAQCMKKALKISAAAQSKGQVDD